MVSSAFRMRTRGTRSSRTELVGRVVEPLDGLRTEEPDISLSLGLDLAEKTYRFGHANEVHPEELVAGLTSRSEHLVDIVDELSPAFGKLEERVIAVLARGVLAGRQGEVERLCDRARGSEEACDEHKDGRGEAGGGPHLWASERRMDLPAVRTAQTLFKG